MRAEIARLCDDGDIERYDSDLTNALAGALTRAVGEGKRGTQKGVGEDP